MKIVWSALCVFFFFLVSLSIPVFGDEPALYGSTISPDFAVVRVVYGNIEGSSVHVEIGVLDYGILDPGEAGDYRPIAPGLHIIQADLLMGELIAQPGQYSTIVVTESRIFVIEDPEHRDPARAQLFLYNLTSSYQTLSLKTADGNTTVVENVPPGNADEAVVNPVSVEIAVYHDDDFLEEVDGLGLRRGGSYSVFVFEENDLIMITVVSARVDST